MAAFAWRKSECEDEEGHTALNMALYGVDAEVFISKLLAHGANPNARDPLGETALFDTLFSPDAKDLIPDLLAHGANPNLPNKQGRTPLQIAQKHHRPDIVRLLKQHGAK
jgi:ankyrin repeat protein